MTSVSSPPLVDGSIDDGIWVGVPVISDFIQDEPNNMADPSERTEVKLVYDDHAIYVSAKMFDSEPDKIVKRLAQRDDWPGGFDDVSDWFSIDFDSRHDHQTAYVMVVNASGVKLDAMVFDDRDYDSDWNAVWDAEVNIDDQGWTVEMRIPFSMLRFTPSNGMVWGFNMGRFIHRKNEHVSWVTFPRGVHGIVSKYGHLTGFKDIKGSNNVELKPYILSGGSDFHDTWLKDTAMEIPGEFIEVNDWSGMNKIGLDVKYGLSSNTTLDFTLNPDFGQIEADPASINLTAYETYYMEKRLFFMENSTMFDTPIEIFYSRRIGENNALIKGAGKLTGKTDSGWSYGMISATTTDDTTGSWLDRMQSGSNNHYLTGRLIKDFLSGNTYAGLMSTYSNNESGSQTIVSLDAVSNLLDNQINIDWQTIAAITDGNTTTGASMEMSYISPELFKFWMDLERFDDGLDISNLGFLRRNNWKQTKIGFGLRKQTPAGIIRKGNINLEYEYAKTITNILLQNKISLNCSLVFMNYWDWVAGFSYEAERQDDWLLYDYYDNMFGPVATLPQSSGFHSSLGTNSSLPYSAIISIGSGQNELEDSGINYSVSAMLRPLEATSLSINYSHAESSESFHWLEQHDLVNDENQVESHYIFANSDNAIETFTFTLNQNINKDLSIRMYSEYFKNSNIFSNYSEYDSSVKYPQYGTDYINGMGEYEDSGYIYSEGAAPLGDQFLDPNLYVGFYPQYTSLNSNFVMKWEYMSGSNLYLVYSYSRTVNGKILDSLTDFFNFEPGASDWIEVYKNQSVFIKVDYWFDL